MSTVARVAAVPAERPTAQQRRVRVFLCDDTPELRRRVRAYLDTEPSIEVVGDADDPVDGLPLIAELQPDVVLLDLSMPRMDGLEAIEHVAATAPDSGIIIYSGFLGAAMGPTALRLGADRYVEKQEALDHVSTIVREVAEARWSGYRPEPAPVEAAVEAQRSAERQVRGRTARLLGRELPRATTVLVIACLLLAGAAAVLLGTDAEVAAVVLLPGVLLAAITFGLEGGVSASAATGSAFLLVLLSGSAEQSWTRDAVAFAVIAMTGVVVGWYADRTEAVVEEHARLADDLRRSNAELEQFAYVASHDLSEPLRTIGGFSELLARRYAGKLDEKGDRYIEHIVAGTHRMQRLIDDLLAFSRAGRADIEPAPVDLSELLDEVRAGLAAALAERRARVETVDLPTVDADASALAIVLQNLLSNAVKFARPGIPPVVRVTAERQPEGWLIAVRDNGIGLDPRFAERVFGMFQRLHGQHEYPGTGIGLAICRRIVERHGGRIWVESAPGSGSVFSFTLPDHPR